jgi:hypothetical protein
MHTTHHGMHAVQKYHTTTTKASNDILPHRGFQPPGLGKEQMTDSHK